MAMLLFIQRLNCDYLGIMSIAGLLKESGHKVEVIITSKQRNVIQTVNRLKPHVVGLPVTAGELKWATSLLQEIKRALPATLNVVGGVHPTICPEIITYDGIDVVCRGEGEYPLLELLNAIDTGKDITRIQNLWVKRDGHIVRNELRPLVENLDVLPHPDKDIYYKYSSIRNYPVRNFIFIRGCPFKCSYCHNHIVAEIYRGKGNFIRTKTPVRAIEEIKEVVTNYKTRLVRFWDDTFTIKRDWLKEFLIRYKEEIDIPFYCTVDIIRVDEDLIRRLKESNCYALEFGIESGNERIRNQILNKHIPDKKFISGAKLMREYNIKIVTQNILGLPEETLEDAWKTIEMNRMIKPTFPFSTVFQPYPHLALTEYSIEKKILNEENIMNYDNLTFFDKSPLQMPSIRKLENLQKLFIAAVFFPWAKPLINILICLPIKRVLLLIHIILNGICYKKAHRLTVFDTARRGWHLSKGYFLTKR